MIDNVYFLTISDNLERINNVNRQAQKLINSGFTNVQMFKNYRFPRSISKALKNMYFPHLGEGIFSCTFGHVSIMKDALDKGYKYILVCEDDIIITNNCINFLKRLDTDYKNLEYDSIRLYHSRQGLTNEEFDKYKYDFVNNELFRYKTLPKNTFIWGTLAYIVSRKYMKAYIDYFDNYIDTADKPNSDYENFIDKYNLKIYMIEDNRLILGTGYKSSLNYNN